MQYPPSTYSTPPSLINRVRQNEADAWSKLYHIYAPLVTSWIRRGGLRPEHAEDLLQEVFHAVVGGIARFRYERPEDTFRGWLLRITRNRLCAFYRKQSAVVGQGAGGNSAQLQLSQLPDWVSQEADSEPPADDPSIEEELVRRAAEAVRCDFAAHTWQAFWRGVVEGQDAAQIAADLGMTPNAVRQAKFRVLARLKETLGEI